MHDTVAQKNFDPVLPPMPDDFEDELEEESVKIVRLVKNKEPLVSVRGDPVGGLYRLGSWRCTEISVTPDVTECEC